MLLAIDVGNTNVVFGVFVGRNLIGHWRLETDVRRTYDLSGLENELCQRARRFSADRPWQFGAFHGVGGAGLVQWQCDSNLTDCRAIARAPGRMGRYSRDRRCN